MSTSMSFPGFFDIESVSKKLESYMRTQESEMCQITNTKKRKFDERWSDIEKEELELEEDYRDDLCFQFNKRQRLDDSYYPLDDDELEEEEVSPLALPSPISVLGENTGPWPFLDTSDAHSDPSHPLAMSIAMRRQLSGYSEVTTVADDHDSSDDSWMSTAPTRVDSSPSLTLSRTSHSTNNSIPNTPRNTLDFSTALNSDDLMADLAAIQDAAEEPNFYDVDFDLDSMAPHERVLLARLAPERFEKADLERLEKAALIKKAFRRSGRLLDRCADEDRAIKLEQRLEEAARELELDADEREFDEVFAELVHV